MTWNGWHTCTWNTVCRWYNWRPVIVLQTHTGFVSVRDRGRRRHIQIVTVTLLHLHLDSMFFNQERAEATIPEFYYLDYEWMFSYSAESIFFSFLLWSPSFAFGFYVHECARRGSFQCLSQGLLCMFSFRSDSTSLILSSERSESSDKHHRLEPWFSDV